MDTILANNKGGAGSIYSRSLTLTAIVAASLLSPHARAASNFQPTLVVSETYMDNVRLVDTRFDQNVSREGDFITQINPGFNWLTESSRFTASADYELQNIIYADNSDHNNTNHVLDVVSNAAFVENLLYLDVGVNYGQWDISFDQPSSGDNLTITNNRTDVLRTRINPYIERQLSEHHTIRAGYTARRSDDDFQITHNNTVDASYISHGNEKLNWQLTYLNQSNDNNVNNVESNFERTNLSASYSLTTQLSIDAGAGYENNDLDLVTEETDGESWFGGLTWRPNSTDVVSGTVGERYFGNTYSFLTKLVRNRFTFNASYNEQTTTNSLLREINGEVDGDPEIVEVEREEAILQKIFTSQLQYAALRFRINASATHDRREVMRTSEKIEIQRLHFGFDHDISRTLTGTASYQRTTNTSDVNARNDKEDRWNFRLNKQLGKQTSSELALQHFSRNSDTIGNDYENNSITASLKMKFM